MTLRPTAVHERLHKLRQVLRNLEHVREVPEEEFLASFRHYWLAERGLHLAAEIVFDIGNHVLANRYNVHPSDYEDVLQKLASQGVITPELRAKMRGLGGFRNVLVHAYLDVDEARVYESLHRELDSFVDFAREIEVFLAEDAGEG